LQAAVEFFEHHYQRGWQAMMAKKLGLITYNPVTDESLIKELLEILALAETDMTIFFRKLALLDIPEFMNNFEIQALMTPLMDAYYIPDQITSGYKERIYNWFEEYIQRLNKDNLPVKKRRRKMDAANPKYVLRNYLSQQSIDKAEQGDFSMIHELLEVMRRPYDEQPDKKIFAEKRPDWARNKPGCSMLSCSS
jgi:uncharacterized protein YdiU (UPF0061 family)